MICTGFAASARGWSASGPPRIVVVDPRPVQAAGALYRDTRVGTFSLYARVQSKGNVRARLGVALTNPSPFAVAVTGIRITAAYGSTRVTLPVEHPLVLRPGTHAVWGILPPAGRVTVLTARMHAQLAIPRALGRIGHVSVPAPVVVTVYASPDVPQDPLALPLLPLDRGELRATFPHAEAVRRPQPSTPSLPLLRTLDCLLASPGPVGIDMVDGKNVPDPALWGLHHPKGR